MAAEAPCPKLAGRKRLEEPMKRLIVLAGLLTAPLAFAQGGGPMQHSPQMHMHEMTPAPAMPAPGGADDPRQLVRLPEMMQEHMLGNMRDHLVTLNGVIGDVADGKFDAAAKLVEARLGMSSLSLHGAAQMAPFMPKPMQDAGTAMHHAASRLAIVLQNAAVTPNADAMRKVSGALHEVTSACTGCHASYRIR
jgi:hypothetical protein